MTEKNIFNNYIHSICIPKWVIFSSDSLIVIFSYLLACLLLNGHILKFPGQTGLPLQISLLLCAYWTGFIIWKPYCALLRFTGIRDIENIFYSVLTAGLMLLFLNFLSRSYPLKFLLILNIVALYILTLSRLVVKFIYTRSNTPGLIS